MKQQGTGYFKVQGTGGFVIPVGNNANRHPSPETGMMRYNTVEDRVEIYDVGGNWVSVAGATGAVTFNDAEGNSVTEHHVHDVQFVGKQIKLINVYSRPTPAE